jgi:hypothetical protein
VGANYFELNSGFDDGWVAREVAILTDHATSHSLTLTKRGFTLLYLTKLFDALSFQQSAYMCVSQIPHFS